MKIRKSAAGAPAAPSGTDQEMLDRLQKETFQYFLEEANPKNGLVRDRTQPGCPASIAALGLALTAYPIGVGWRPETGFLPYRWEGYDEALILYVLALGSATHPIPPECYRAWETTYAWKKIYKIELLYAGPLFTHQLSHVWIDFRGIQDDFMAEHRLDYFENSRRAALVQREYAIRNPKEFRHYGRDCWGLTASDGPGPATMTVDGVERQFYGYLARRALRAG